MARLTGKVALITGAAGGQGTAEAELSCGRRLRWSSPTSMRQRARA
jgi:NAD(P)-dependent dehydrogenase (short-subunit alcohol dehydrogenase family)